MDCTRREVLAGIPAGLLLSGFLGEVRAQQSKATSSARILFNENPLGPSPKALAAIESSKSNLARYPLGQAPQLVRKLKQKFGLPVDPNEGSSLSLKLDAAAQGTHDVVLGVGSSEILRAAAWAYCSDGGTIVEGYPGYAAIGNDASRIPGATVERKMIPLDQHYRLDATAMIDAIDESTRIVVICNPNNPTGTVITPSQIEAIANAAPSDALVFVDEAYIEFLGEEAESCSALNLALDRDNVLVSRTFSKIYGMAGLRIGYGVSSQSVVERIRPYMLGPLGLNMAGIVGALAAMEDFAHVQNTLDLNSSVQDQWRRNFRDIGWQMAKSSACFCWVDTGDDCSALVQFLANRGVLISGGQRWNLPNYVRISTGTEEENARLLDGIRAFRQA